MNAGDARPTDWEQRFALLLTAHHHASFAFRAARQAFVFVATTASATFSAAR